MFMADRPCAARRAALFAERAAVRYAISLGALTLAAGLLAACQTSSDRELAARSCTQAGAPGTPAFEACVDGTLAEWADFHRRTQRIVR